MTHKEFVRWYNSTGIVFRPKNETPPPDRAETMQAIEKSHESLAQTIAESKVQDEKNHQLTLKALELFDDEALIQALRDRGFEGEIYKKFRL